MKTDLQNGPAEFVVQLGQLTETGCDRLPNLRLADGTTRFTFNEACEQARMATKKWGLAALVCHYSGSVASPDWGVRNEHQD